MGSLPLVAPAGELSISAPLQVEPDDIPLLVPIAVSRSKLETEIANWHANAPTYRRRGWVLLDANPETLRIEVGFIALVAFGDQQLPVVTSAVRLCYENYDLWAPSLTFIEPRSGVPCNPLVPALEKLDSGEVRNALIGHPLTGKPFLCIPGVREYHTHPQHTGDSWLLHRDAGAGRLAVICDQVWRRMARNVVGLSVQLQSMPVIGTQLVVALTQGDVDTLPQVST